MEEVPEGIFVRINKNTLVNRAYVIGVEKDMVMLNLTDPETGNAIKLTTSPNYQMDFDFKL